MVAIFRSLSSFSAWPLPGLFSKKKDGSDTTTIISGVKVGASAPEVKTTAVAIKAIADTPKAPSIPPAKVDEKKEISSKAIAVAKILPEDTLSKLCEVQQSLMQELDRMLAKPERLTRLGQWEKANGLLNDLKLISFQIKTLLKAKDKSLSEKEKEIVSDGKKRLQILVKLGVFDTKLKELSKTLHKNLVEYQHRKTEASEEAVLELLASKDYTTILREYVTRTAKYAAGLTAGSIALYTASSYGLLSGLASQFHPLLGCAVAIPESIITSIPALTLTTPLLAPVAALGSNTLSQGLNKVYAPLVELTEELYNLKDAATDTAEFLGNSVNCLYSHAKQALTAGAAISVASLTARVVAQTGIVSSMIEPLAPEVAFLTRSAEQATLFVTKSLNPLKLAGLTTIGAGSLAASTILIDNPNIKIPSTKQISYSVPKAANFIRKAAIVTTVATGAVATYIYAPAMLDHAISNTACMIGNSVSHLTSSLFENSTELFTCAAPAAQQTIGEMITGAASEAIGQTAIFIGKRAALTTAALYTATLPSLVKGAVNYGISKVEGSLPTADSAKTPGPIQSGEKNGSKDPAANGAIARDVDGAGIQDPPDNVVNRAPAVQVDDIPAVQKVGNIPAVQVGNVVSMVQTGHKIATKMFNEAIGQTTIFVAKKAALTAGTIYTTAQNLPGLIKETVKYGISKVGGSLPTLNSTKTSNPVKPDNKNNSKLLSKNKKRKLRHVDNVVAVGQDAPPSTPVAPLHDDNGEKVQYRAASPRNNHQSSKSLIDADGFRIVRRKRRR
jgi:hypothetical protein